MIVRLLAVFQIQLYVQKIIRFSMVPDEGPFTDTIRSKCTSILTNKSGVAWSLGTNLNYNIQNGISTWMWIFSCVLTISDAFIKYNSDINILK